MHETTEADLRNLTPAQGVALSWLVEMEARWENMRKTPSRAGGTAVSATQSLLEVQKAYDAFHSRLVAYNKRYTPAHVPELLLNTPVRLALWCREMRELYLRVEHDSQIPCPVHLLEKAYGWAERVRVRMNTGPFSRSPRPDTIRAAIDNLEALVQWCDGLAVVAAAV